MDFNRIVCTVPHNTKIVTRHEIKQHLYITHSDEDDYLDGLASVATAMIDGPTGIGISIASATYQASLDYLASGVRIPLGPVVSIISITIDGETVPSNSYRLELGRNPAMIYTDYPQASANRDGVKITFVSGYQSIPSDLKHAALLMIGHWYQNREAVSAEALREVPMAVSFILERYRAI